MPPIFHSLSTARSLALLLCCALFLSLSGEQARAAARNTDTGGKTGKAATQTEKASGSSSSQSKPASLKTKNGKAARSSSSKKAYTRNASASYSYDYKSCVIYNVRNNKVLFTRNGDRKIPPASLTKVLSIYVAEDAIRNRKIKRKTRVTISARAAAAGGSRMGLRAGDKVPLDDLLKGMAVASGNDASIAVAEFIGGSEDKFVTMMNKKARAIGMTRSTFKNASGLPAPGQYTTARDMLALARSYLKAYPGNLDRYHSKSVHVYKSKYSCNANPLLGVLEGADGLKTGFVNASGYNIIATAQRGKQRYIGVILGAPTSTVRAEQARTLMEACFTRPSTFAAGKADVNARAKSNASSEVTRKATPKGSAKATAGAAKSVQGNKQAVKTKNNGKSGVAAQSGGKNRGKAVTVRQSGGKKNTPTSNNTAGKSEKKKKSPEKSSSIKNQIRQQPLVLQSYS